jgi:hypothetical protein
MKISKLAVFKYGISAVVGLGVSKIVDGVVQNNVTPAGLISNICVKVAKLALTMLITNMAEKHVNVFIDSVVDGVEKTKLDH